METALGVHYNPQNDEISFRIFSKHAEQIQIYFYGAAYGMDEVLVKKLSRDQDHWNLTLPRSEMKEAGLAEDYFYYGYRAWGPNWVYREDWQKGSEQGFLSDVDAQGNRFNPNKLLIDPYAGEISHDPQIADIYIDPNQYIDDYYGGAYRMKDTGKIAPKSVGFLRALPANYGVKPRRLLKDDIIYEVSLRGMTMLDGEIPQNERGTFKGMAQKAGYLKELGVTAVEFLPVQEFADEQNDGNPRGDNYWGYMTVNYFSPNRRFSADKSPGGPIREFQAMVKAFHELGIKVFLDVVYNHTGEGLLYRNIGQGNPTTETEIAEAVRKAHAYRDNPQLQDYRAACYLSFTGLDNQSYYYLQDQNRRYEGRGQCGGNLNYDHEVVKKLMIDSLKYWADRMGVDGFRFDLAPVLSITQNGADYRADPATRIFDHISRMLPARTVNFESGVDLIAEPWGDNSGISWLDKFPESWSLWNDRFRNALKISLNKYGAAPLQIGALSKSLSGSKETIGKRPWNSINYLVSHDDCNSLRNIFSYNEFFHLTEAVANDDQLSWNQGGGMELQLKAVRNAFALLMLSAGVPMFTGGDELFRPIPPYDQDRGIGKMNMVWVDNPEVYLDFTPYHEMKACLETGNQMAYRHLIETRPELYTFKFVQNLIRFRSRHESLRPSEYYSGAVNPRNGLKDISWYKADGTEIGGADWDGGDFIAYRINTQFENTSDDDAQAGSIYVAYNRSPNQQQLCFPQNLNGMRWRRVLDTDNTAGWMKARQNFDGGATPLENEYLLHPRSILVLIENDRWRIET